MPRIINGCWQLSEGHGAGLAGNEEVNHHLTALAQAGFSVFDCADIYTGVETRLGSFLAAYARRFGRARMRRLRIHTKFVPDLEALPRITRDYVARIIDRSLMRLRLDRLDLVQFHWWDFGIPGYVETARWLQDLQRAGKIRNLGVTNCDVPHLKTLVDEGIPVVANQVQYSLLDHRPEREMADFCLRKGIHLLCYGALAGGFLSERYWHMPRPETPLANRSLVKYMLIIEAFGGWPLFCELLGALKEVAGKHGVGIANAATAYILAKPAVAAVIVGTRNASRLEDNRRSLGLVLDASDRRKIETVLDKRKGPRGDVFGLEREKGGPHAAIMKTDLNRDRP